MIPYFAIPIDEHAPRDCCFSEYIPGHTRNMSRSGGEREWRVEDSSREKNKQINTPKNEEPITDPLAQPTIGRDPQESVKKHLSEQNIIVQHVRLILIGHQGSIDPSNRYKSARALGVILVTRSNNIHSESYRCYKAGMYHSTDFETQLLDHDILI